MADNDQERPRGQRPSPLSGLASKEVAVVDEASDVLEEYDQMQGVQEILGMPERQRHGCVAQIRGITLRNAAGNIVGETEEWRCQCQERFKGRNPAETEALYLRHIRGHDPKVPKKLPNGL